MSPPDATADVEAQPLLQSLSARFNNTKLRLQDMWNVFDVLNFQKSYNKSFVDLTAGQWNEVNQLVNSLEYNKFANGLGATAFAGDVAKQLKAMSASGNKKLVGWDASQDYVSRLSTSRPTNPPKPPSDRSLDPLLLRPLHNV